MNSGELSQLTNHWYVTAGNGDAVVRVFPGMSLGETDTGELSLDGDDAMLSLSIDSNDSLVVNVVSGGELEAEDGEFCEKHHLALDSPGLIRLPNNILRFDRGILNEARTDAPSLPCAVWRTAEAENRTPETSSIDTAQLPLAAEIIVPETNAPESSAPGPDEPQSISSTTEPPILREVPTKTASSHKQSMSSFAAAALVGLVCVGIWLVYSGIPSSITLDQQAPVARQIEAVEGSRPPAVQTTVQTTVEEAPTVVPPDRDQIFTKSKSTPAPELIATPAIETPALETPAFETPATAARETPATSGPDTSATAALESPATSPSERTVVIAIPPNEPVAETIASTPAIAAAKPLSQNRPTPEVAERTAPRNTSSAPSTRNPVSRREVAGAGPAPTSEAAAEAELRREQEQAQMALVIYERDLLAAELALAQGRLTQPPEDNAYSLYKKLVASNPESSDARRGFQALGAALVNRAFAELAAKRWGDARATLAAAAEAGASPNLVADLSGEVAYQQRLADAEAGRFAALYPAAELVALKRTTPRLRRYAPDGIDMVQIEFTVSVAGNVQDIEVLGGPPQRLERIVRQAVTDWRFEPVLSGTRPIPVRTRVGLEIP